MNAERYTDTETTCPYCAGRTRISYTKVPRHHRAWTDGDGAKYVEHWGECRDYVCRNCDTEWTMPEDAFQ